MVSWSDEEGMMRMAKTHMRSWLKGYRQATVLIYMQQCFMNCEISRSVR